MTNKSKLPNRRSIRLKGYDYSRQGLYFITLCIYHKSNIFGTIRDGKMILNAAGKVASDCWFAIPEHFTNAILHEFVVMPNHIHGIIELQELSPVIKSSRIKNEYGHIIPYSIASIVKGYKIGVTKWVRQNMKIHRVWQRDYYEHIIRNYPAYQRISEYIKNNPQKWSDDRFNPMQSP